MTDQDRDEALRLLLERLKADGGRYLLSVALTREERDKEPEPTFGGKGSHRWLSDEEYAGLIERLARSQPQGEPVAWLYRAKLVSINSETVSQQPPDRVSDVDLYDVTPLYTVPPAQAIPEEILSYVVHDEECSKVKAWPPETKQLVECTCGLDKLLSAAPQPLEQELRKLHSVIEGTVDPADGALGTPEYYADLQRQLQAMHDKLEAAQKDAERYCWLCDPDNEASPAWLVVQEIGSGKFEIDAAIDAARAEKPNA